MPSTRDLLVYSPEYNTDLASFGIDKPFALDRGHCVLAELEREFGARIAYSLPAPMSEADLSLVHSAAYLQSLKEDRTWLEIFELSPPEYDPEKARRPLSDLMADIRLKCGGTLLASERALAHGMAANLGGGYHHAFPDAGRGFCSLNDVAVTIRSIQKRGLARKFMVVDLDFHQGDGTALIFAGDPDVFTLSVHSAEGWPETKQESSLDVEITADQTHLYIEKTGEALARALDSFLPEAVIYVAGSDPYELDVLPGTSYIKLSLDDMRRRDELVLDTFWAKRIPLSMVFAGGYGPDVWRVHHQAVRHMLLLAGALELPLAHGR